MKLVLKKSLIIKIIIIIVCFLLAFIFITGTVARYRTNAHSTANLDAAFYVLNENYQTMNLNLDSISPRKEPYVYRFSIANFKDTDRTEVTLEYDLEIVTTTNLPLQYELYLNEEYTKQGANNIIVTDDILPDEFGTYFRTIKTSKKTFGISSNEINEYQLVVYFPEEYKNIEYQDILELVEIRVNSRQVI